MLTIYTASVTLGSGLKLDRDFDSHTIVINHYRVSVTHSKTNFSYEKFETFLCKVSKLNWLTLQSHFLIFSNFCNFKNQSEENGLSLSFKVFTGPCVKAVHSSVAF